jgi:hypothetical protein
VPSYSIGLSVAQNDERVRQGLRRAVGGHLPFDHRLDHRLEQRGLGLGRGAVDLSASNMLVNTGRAGR